MTTISQNWLDDAFRAAKHDFISGLKNPSRYDFSNLQTIDDVYNEAENIQKAQAKTKTLRALKKIEPFIVGINDYSDTIDTFVQAKAEILALLWGPLRLLLQMTSSLLTVFEKMVKVLSDIGHALPQFKKYTDLFEENDQVKQAMCLFYVDILDFYKILLNFLENKTRNTFFEALWPSIRSKIDVVRCNIERHKLLMTSQVTLEDVAQSYEARKQAMREYEEQQKFRDRQDFEAMVSEYSPSTHHRKLAEILDRTSPGSGGWLAQKPEFIQWSRRNNTINRCLWLYGIPGSGKSYLAAGSIRRLQRSQNLVLFVFLTHDDQASGGAIEVMHSLIFQAAKGNRNLMPLVYGHVKSDQQAMPNNSKFESDPDFVLELLIKILELCTQVFIVVDGLDELEERPRQPVLEALIKIVEKSKAARVLISSREERDIVKKLEGRAISLRVDRNNAEDVQLYADSELQSWLSDLKDLQADDDMLATAKESVAHVVQASEGMILYTKLVLKVLKEQGTASDIELQLENLPQGLEQAYARVLDRIRDRAVVKKVLHWVLCARIPLREEQILQALVIEPAAQDFTKGRKQFRDIRRECGPIIESSKENLASTSTFRSFMDGVVRFVHFSAKEYLLNQSNGFLDMRASNMDAAIVCSTYLCFASLDVLFTTSLAGYETVLDQRILTGDVVFFEYAAIEWLEHIKACSFQEDFSRLTDILSVLFNTRNIITSLTPTESSKYSSSFEGFRDHSDVRNYLIGTDRQTGRARLGLLGDHEDDCPGLYTTLRTLRQQVEALLCENPQHTQGCHCDTIYRLYGSAVFYCHKPYCPRNRHGFQSRTTRDEHSAIHSRKYRFLEGEPKHPSIGFRSNGALSQNWPEDQANKNHLSLTDTMLDDEELQDMLIDAVTQDNIEGIKVLVASRVNIAELFSTYWKPSPDSDFIQFHPALIALAAWKGSDITLQYILNLKIEGLPVAGCLGTALAVAIEFKRLQNIKLLLSYGADINQYNTTSPIVPPEILNIYREGDVDKFPYYTGYERALSLWDPDLMNYLVDTCGVVIRTKLSGIFCARPAVLHLGLQEARDKFSELRKYILDPEALEKGMYQAADYCSPKALQSCVDRGANVEYIPPGAYGSALAVSLGRPRVQYRKITSILRLYGAKESDFLVDVA
ncbi:hypothetical protein F5Y10DRAFT_272930 [Nemania abortiva]|nr:hypothetical protein F5Y10DRAFT_272930 [Nemania abortiva]